MNSKTTLAVIGGLALGTGLVYFLNPQRGARRRHRARRRLGEAWREGRHGVERASAGAQTLLDRARFRLQSQPHSDQVLEERIRAKLRRLLTYPRAVEVRVRNGRVHLEGPVLASEIDRVLERVGALTGVEVLEDRLSIVERRGDPFAPSRRRRVRNTVARVSGSTATRAVLGASGGALAVLGLRRRAALPAAAGLLGLALAGDRIVGGPGNGRWS
jgi:hypothetical protein